jgi:hypothetical protein
MKPTLNTPTWMNMAIATSATATATSDFGSGFFRVSDTAHQLPIPLSVAMSGAAERPMPLNNSATGFGLLALDGNTLTFNFRYSGLSSAPFAAHIHGPATTAGTGPILVDLAAFNGGAYGTSGGVSGKIIITDAQKAMILAGLTYVNFHTTAHSGGELRGQIAPVLMQTSLSGAAERPTAVNTGASGLGVFTLVGTQLTFNVTYRGLSGPASAAHLHGSANLMGSAGVLVDLAAYNGGGYGSSGRVAGTINLTPTQLAAVIDGQTYFNFHTTAHQAGELRGQVVPQATAVPFTALLSGLLERPTPLTNNASGTAFFSLEGDTLAFSISYSNLSGTATAAHIHGPATSSQSMGIQVDLAPYNGGAFSTSGTLAGTVVLTPAQRTMLLNGQAYVNVHTMAHQGGEIRGQIAPVLMQSYLSGASERPPVFTPATALGTFALVLNQLSFDITYGGLPTTATAAHIHGPATISQSAGVLVDLAPFNGGAYGTSGTIFGHVMLPITQLANVIDAMTYVNIHTAPNQGGEIRGHILR